MYVSRGVLGMLCARELYILVVCARELCILVVLCVSRGVLGMLLCWMRCVRRGVFGVRYVRCVMR